MTDDFDHTDPAELGHRVASMVRDHLAEHVYGGHGFPPFPSELAESVENLGRFLRGDVIDCNGKALELDRVRCALNQVLIVCYGSPVGDYPDEVPPLFEIMRIFRCPLSKSAIGQLVMRTITRLGIAPPFGEGCAAFLTEVGTRCPRCDDATFDGCRARAELGLRVLQ